MMKKVLVLALVLGVVSLANASLDLATVNGVDYSVDTASQTVTISGENVIGFFMVLVPDAGTLFWQQELGPGDPPRIMIYPPDPYPPIDYPGAIIVSGSTGTATGVDGPFMAFTYSGGTTEVTILDEIEWGLGDAVIYFEGDISTALADYTITIPEPATLALLGLGGLLLRRK